MIEIFRIFFKAILRAILSIIFTVFTFVGIALLVPVAALCMIILMFVGLYEITIWIIKEIKNT